MEKDKEYLGTAPIGKLLFKLAIPVVIAQLINMLYNVVDRIYIGHMPGNGDAALTGVGVCMPLIMIVSAFAALVGTGGSPRASIAMGEKNNDKAEVVLGNCFSLQILISIILTIILISFGRPLLMAFGASDDTIGYAVDYLRIYALGTIFVQVTLGMNAFITCQGFTKTGMFSVLIGAVINIILDPILIYGLHMGVKGAALATIISQAASCLWIILFLTGKKTILHLRLKNMAMHAKVILPCISLGMAAFIMQSSESIIAICFNVSLKKYGGDIAVGAMTILVSVMQFAMLPMMGIAQGAQPISSYNFGAKNIDRVKKTFRYLLLSCCVYSFLLWGAIMIAPRMFAGIFTPKVELLDFTEKALRIYCGALCLFGIQNACQMTFVSIGCSVSSIIVAVVRKFVLLLPFIYLMPLLVSDKTMGVYMAEPIADVIAVTFTVILFSVQFKKALAKQAAIN